MRVPAFLRRDPQDATALPKRLLVVATVAAVLAIAFASAMLLIDQPTEYRASPQSWEVGDDYVVVMDVFWSSHHMAGSWHSWASGSVEQARLVDGSDVARILAGQEPLTLHGTWTGWNGGQSPVGDFDFDVPAFTCTGVNGRCETGDLPALVLTRGDAWVGIKQASLQQGDGPVSISAHYSRGYLQPLFMGAATIATTGIVVSLGAGVWWAAGRNRSPKDDAPVGFEEAPNTESMLRLTKLSELYVATISRYFWISAIAVVAGAIAVEAYFGPRLEDLIFHMTGNEALGIWYFFLTWWIVPFAMAVAAVFWFAQLSTVRRELSRWRAFSRRLHDIESAVLQ